MNKFPHMMHLLASPRCVHALNMSEIFGAGSYRGQWRGMRKEGLGVYSYPAAAAGGGTGARYEGEWRDNLKDGRGVYYFPKVVGKGKEPLAPSDALAA